MKLAKCILLGMSIWLSGMVIAQSTMDYPLDTIEGQVYYRYTVERSIGLYRISKNFGVSQEAILQANPHLQTTGLRYDEIILVPAYNLHTEAVGAQSTVDKVEPVVVVEEKKEEKKPLIKHRLFPRKSIKQDTIAVEEAIMVDSVIVSNDSSIVRLAMLLPLQAEAIKRDKNIDRFYDYYAGALIAINEVQATGKKIEVFTYDVGKTAQKTIELLNDSTWTHVDAMIGPAYSQQVNTASTFAKADSTWLLVPFLSNVVDVAHNPYMLQFNPSEQTEADTLARYLAQYGDSVNCVLIEAKNGDVIPSGILALHQALEAHHVPTSTISLTAILTDSLDGAFKADMENIVIFNTEKYGNLQAVMPHLLKGYTNYRITLFSHYSWQNEKIIIPQIYTSVFSDSVIVTEAYKNVYEQYFNHPLSSTQPRYDLLGYDQTRHLLDLLSHSTDTIDTQLWYGSQSDILYKKVSADGGYENQLIHIIRK